MLSLRDSTHLLKGQSAAIVFLFFVNRKLLRFDLKVCYVFDQTDTTHAFEAPDHR